MSKKDDFFSAMESQIKKWDAAVDQLNAKGQKIGVEARNPLMIVIGCPTLGRDVGTRIALDVLDAQQRLFSAQLDLWQAGNDYLLGRIGLARDR